MKRTPHCQRSVSARRGSLMPAIVVALLVCASAVAVAVDWALLDASHTELTTAAQAAALAAGLELAGDDLLRPDVAPETRMGQARSAARRLARQNLVAGEPLELDLSDRSVRFGKSVRDNDAEVDVFLETPHKIDTVVVTAARLRSRGNPVALLFPGVTRQPGGDVAVRVSVAIDNHVAGFRPSATLPVPVLPIAVPCDLLPRQTDDKDGAVAGTNSSDAAERGGSVTPEDGGQAADQWSWDSHTGRAVRRPDGLPEMVLTLSSGSRNQERGNTLFLDVNNDLRDRELARQIRFGLSEADLESWNGELLLPTVPETFAGKSGIDELSLSALEELRGQIRACWICTSVGEAGSDGVCRVVCSEMIAVRILDVRINALQSCELIVQPAVLVTRTAMLPAELGLSREDVAASPYVYKVYVTHQEFTR